MPPDGPTLRDRYAADLRSGSLAVQVTAVPLALAAGVASGQTESVRQETTVSFVDGDVQTTVMPRSTGLESRVSEFHMQQFEQALQHRLRLIEAILRMANISVSLI